MAKGYEIVVLTPEDAGQWDELIAPYESRQMFHRRAWLDYLAASRKLNIRLWAIRKGSQTVGYFCGGILRKGPFRILGSPLKGWGTNSMGPVVGGHIDQGSLLKALDCLAHREHVALMELENSILSEKAMVAAQYEAISDWTYVVTLTPENPDVMWSAMYSTCRNRIRKAMKAGLTVEDTDDPAVADEYYELYSHLIRRKGLVPTYPCESPRELVRHLKKVDSLFALRVRDASGRVLAIALFPHDEQTMYFWGGASWPDGHKLCPNEYLHWSAMSLAATRGLRVYNMSGYGRFKTKFGGTLTPVKRWHKCYWRTARWARHGYEMYFQKWIRVQGWWQQIFHSRERA